MVRSVLALLACAACQGQGTPGADPVAGSGSTSPHATAAAPADAAIAVLDAGPRTDPELDPASAELPGAQADPGRAIAELGAIPAWQAVVDRAQLLGRRRQRGVVYGRVGPALLVPGPTPAIDAGVADAGVAPDAGLVKSPYVWLIDDTEGNGTLGIRIALGDKAREGERIAAGGAWHLDEDRSWYWKPDAIQPLPPAPPSDLVDPPPPAPGHAIATGGLPSGARTISVARDNDAVYFQVVGPPPLTDGDGWQVADGPGKPVAALMNLPGERPSYGGQDMRAPDERWQLKRGQIYWVRIGKVRKRGDNVLVNARTAPIRIL
jgi:hypothetical protein